MKARSVIRVAGLLTSGTDVGTGVGGATEPPRVGDILAADNNDHPVRCDGDGHDEAT